MGAMKNLLIKQQEKKMNRDNFTETELEMLKGTSEHQVLEVLSNLLNLGVTPVEILKLVMLTLQELRPGWTVDGKPDLRVVQEGSDE
tara:strand:+ start:450 stop:710 length:261 start_codon:yes stop_codon:yes gene_type:complete